MSKRFWVAFLGGWAIFFGGVVWAAESHALTSDDAYLGTLDAADITYPTPQYAIDAGHEICTSIPQYQKWYPEDWRTPLTVDVDEAVESPDFRITDAEVLVDAAVKFYCPQAAAKPKVSSGIKGAIGGPFQS